MSQNHGGEDRKEREQRLRKSSKLVNCGRGTKGRAMSRGAADQPECGRGTAGGQTEGDAAHWVEHRLTRKVTRRQQLDIQTEKPLQRLKIKLGKKFW